MGASNNQYDRALSVTDLPMGPGAGQIPPADESHPLSWFRSTEQTGTGAPQNVAHGLGRVPNMVIVTITELPAGLAAGADVALGVSDATNVVLTVSPNTVKFLVYAI